jgi:hypothetical protein
MTYHRGASVKAKSGRRFCAVARDATVLTARPILLRELTQHFPDAADSSIIRHRIETLSVSFLTLGALGQPKLPARERLSGRENRQSLVRGRLSCR